MKRDIRSTLNPPALMNAAAEAIGNTPMVELHRVREKLGLTGRLLMKLEMLNPGFSKKDRIALEMVRDARNDGSLREGQTVVELTSGNTGTGLAIVCKAMGHPFIAVMSRGNSIERARMMRALGAEVVLVDQAPGSVSGQVSGPDLAKVAQRAEELMREREAFRADQFNLEASRLAHYRHTGPEIWQQSQGQVDVFVDFVGSGGTFAGTTRYLKEQRPSVRGYVVEPASAAVMAGKAVTNPGHRIQGGGYSMPDLKLIDRSLIDGFVQVTDEQAMDAARLLAAEEGIFAGFSSGANLAAAVDLLEGSEQGATVALLACDSGLKYLSTDLYPREA